MQKNSKFLKNDFYRKIKSLSEDSENSKDFNDLSKEDESYKKNLNESLQKEFLKQKNYLLKFSENFTEKQKKRNIENKKFIKENFQNFEKKILTKLENNILSKLENNILSKLLNLFENIEKKLKKNIKNESKIIIGEIQKTKEKNKKLSNSNFNKKKSIGNIESEKQNTVKEEDKIREKMISNKNDSKNDFNQRDQFLDESIRINFINNSGKQFSQSKKIIEQNNNNLKNQKKNEIEQKFYPNTEMNDLKNDFNKKIIIKSTSEYNLKKNKSIKENFSDDNKNKKKEINKNKEGDDVFATVDYDENLKPLKSNNFLNLDLKYQEEKNLNKFNSSKNNNYENKITKMENNKGPKKIVFSLNNNSSEENRYNPNLIIKIDNFKREKTSERNLIEAQQKIENNEKQKNFENEKFNNNLKNKKYNNNSPIKDNNDSQDSLLIISDEEESIDFYLKSKNKQKSENSNNNKILNDKSKSIIKEFEIYLQHENLLQLTTLLIYPNETLIKKIKKDFFKILKEKKINFQILKLLIEKAKIDLNKKDSENNSILHLLIKYNQNDLLKFILQNKNNLNEIDPLDNNRQTPLHLSLIRNNKIAFYLLYNNKASLKLKDVYDNNCLHFAAMYCDKDILKFILDKNLLDFREVNFDGNMPVFSAAIYQRIHVVKIFLGYQDEKDLFKRNAKYEYSNAYELLSVKYDKKTLIQEGILNPQIFNQDNI